MKTIFHIVLGFVVLLLDICFVVFLIFLSAKTADYFYNLNHLIPDPTARGEDFGEGLIVIAAVLASLLVSIPLCYPLSKFLYKLLGGGK